MSEKVLTLAERFEKHKKKLWNGGMATRRPYGVVFYYIQRIELDIDDPDRDIRLENIVKQLDADFEGTVDAMAEACNREARQRQEALEKELQLTVS